GEADLAEIFAADLHVAVDLAHDALTVVGSLDGGASADDWPRGCLGDGSGGLAIPCTEREADRADASERQRARPRPQRPKREHVPYPSRVCNHAAAYSGEIKALPGRVKWPDLR